MRAWRKLESNILTSDRLSRVSDSAKWLFVLLLAAQDDEGKYPWTRPRIQALIATTDWDIPRTESLLSELRLVGVSETREGFVWLHNGAEKNGIPANSKAHPVIYPPVPELGTESLTTRGRIAGDSQEKSRVEIEKTPVPDGTGGVGERKESEKKKPVWEPEDWFKPLTKLPGYKRQNYEGSQDTIRKACLVQGADKAAVVQAFCEYWPIGRLKHERWNSPVHTLVRTLDVQINKVIGKERNNGYGLAGSFEKPKVRPDNPFIEYS